MGQGPTGPSVGMGHPGAKAVWWIERTCQHNAFCDVAVEGQIARGNRDLNHWRGLLTACTWLASVSFFWPSSSSYRSVSKMTMKTIVKHPTYRIYHYLCRVWWMYSHFIPTLLSINIHCTCLHYAHYKKQQQIAALTVPATCAVCGISPTTHMRHGLWCKDNAHLMCLVGVPTQGRWWSGPKLPDTTVDTRSLNYLIARGFFDLIQLYLGNCRFTCSQINTFWTCITLTWSRVLILFSQRYWNSHCCTRC